MRLLVFGNSGSGKSTLARRLCELHGLVHLDLDSIVWEPGKIAVQRATEDVHADLDRFVAGNESWVVEGCYAELIERALPLDVEMALAVMRQERYAGETYGMLCGRPAVGARPWP